MLLDILGLSAVVYIAKHVNVNLLIDAVVPAYATATALIIVVGIATVRASPTPSTRRSTAPKGFDATRASATPASGPVMSSPPQEVPGPQEAVRGFRAGLRSPHSPRNPRIRAWSAEADPQRPIRGRLEKQASTAPSGRMELQAGAEKFLGVWAAERQENVAEFIRENGAPWLAQKLLSREAQSITVTVTPHFPSGGLIVDTSGFLGTNDVLPFTGVPRTFRNKKKEELRGMCILTEDGDILGNSTRLEDGMKLRAHRFIDKEGLMCFDVTMTFADGHVAHKVEWYRKVEDYVWPDELPEDAGTAPGGRGNE